MGSSGLGTRGWRLGNRGSRFGVRLSGTTLFLVLGLLVVHSLGAIARERPQPAQEPALMITVRVYNYAQASSQTLAAAEAEAVLILLDAGVRTTWLDCPLEAEEFASHPACQEALGPTDVVLRILPREMAERMPFHYAKVGFAFLTTEGPRGSMVGVFYHRIHALARGDEQGLRLGLGRAIAHEIGHLMLRTDAHSPRGIMRGDWRREDFRGGTVVLRFTPQQAEIMRAEVRARRTQQEAARIASERPRR